MEGRRDGSWLFARGGYVKYIKIVESCKKRKGFVRFREKERGEDFCTTRIRKIVDSFDN